MLFTTNPLIHKHNAINLCTPHSKKTISAEVTNDIYIIESDIRIQSYFVSFSVWELAPLIIHFIKYILSNYISYLTICSI